MAWVTPRTWVVGEQGTAAKLNEISSALIDLDRRTSPVGAVVDTAQTTASTSYTDLATAGPAVTVTIGSTGKALVTFSADMSNTNAAAENRMSYAVSGATTTAAADAISLNFVSPSAGTGGNSGMTVLLTGLNAGSTTFTAKYRVNAGTGTFQRRRLSATPLGS